LGKNALNVDPPERMAARLTHLSVGARAAMLMFVSNTRKVLYLMLGRHFATTLSDLEHQQ